MRQHWLNYLLIWVLTACATVENNTDTIGVGSCLSYEERTGQTLSPNAAKALIPALELVQASNGSPDRQFNQAIDILDDLLGSETRLTPFDKATIYEYRGSFKLQIIPPDYEGALSDFQKAVELCALPREREVQNIFNIAQLNFQRERYDLAAARLEEFIVFQQAKNLEISSNIWYLLAASYVAQEMYDKARVPMEKALSAHEVDVEAKTTRRKITYYQMMNVIYAELGIRKERIKLLKKASEYFPDNEQFQDQLLFLVSDGESGSDYIRIRDSQTVFPFQRSDREAQPLIRIPPRYPVDCPAGGLGIEQQVELAFDVSEEGDTENIRVTKSDNSCLDPYAIEAVSQWKYQRKYVNGEPVKRKDVQTRFIFIFDENEETAE